MTTTTINADISDLWPTPVWMGAIAAGDLVEIAALARPGTTDITAQPLIVIRELELTAGAVDPDRRDLTWRHQLETWPPGFHLGMRYCGVAVRAMVIVDSEVPAEHADSGAISLHDPRAGIANVGLPGLPWGRPVKVPLHTGVAFAHPGWLSYSVAPVRTPHHMTVWVAEAC